MRPNGNSAKTVLPSDRCYRKGVYIQHRSLLDNTDASVRGPKKRCVRIEEGTCNAEVGVEKVEDTQ